MEAWSLVGRSKDPGSSEVEWVGVYLVHAVTQDGYVSGRCVCLLNRCEDIEDPEGSSYSVGKRTGRYIELWYLRRYGTLVLDDGREIETLPDKVL